MDLEQELLCLTKSRHLRVTFTLIVLAWLHP